MLYYLFIRVRAIYNAQTYKALEVHFTNPYFVV
jgi:hypothetical protein